jgi:hypothetical protein
VQRRNAGGTGNDKKNENGLAFLPSRALSKGGECLSTQYTNAKAKYRFRCAIGHEWEALYSNKWLPAFTIE